MHRLTSLVAAATAAVLVLAACGSDDGPSDTTSTEPTTSTAAPGGEEVPGEIAGVHWILDGYYTVGGLQSLEVTDSGAGLTIDAAGAVAIDTGCNQGSATATFDGDLLQIGPIAVTERACLDQDVMRIEQMLLGQLEEQQYWYVEDGTLSLTAANISDTGLHFHDAANPPTTDTTVPPATTPDDPTTTVPRTSPTDPSTTVPRTSPTDPTTTVPPQSSEVPGEIAGVHWIFDGYYTVGGLQPLPATDTGAGLTIEPDGTVTLDGGCNQGSATAGFDGQLVQLSDIISTAKACTDEGVMQVESMLFGQLAEQQYWYVADGTLQLTAARISDTGLHFHDAANPPADDGTGDTIAPPDT